MAAEKSTICELIRDQDCHLSRHMGKKNRSKNLVTNVGSFCPVKLHLSSVRAKNKRPKGSHIVHLSTMCHIYCHILFFLIGPKNTNLVEDIEILLSINFRQIQFSGFRAVLSKKKIPFADSMSLTLCKSYLSSNAEACLYKQSPNSM